MQAACDVQTLAHQQSLIGNFIASALFVARLQGTVAHQIADFPADGFEFDVEHSTHVVARKAKMTTWIAALVWLVLAGIITSGMISVRDIDWRGVMAD